MTQYRRGPIAPLPRVRLGDEVYDELVARLLSHRFASGERLTIDVLARDLGVSQTPVREALTRMEAGGVVVRTHLAGYRVAPELTRSQFEELVEVRLLLEPAAAGRAARSMTPAAVAALAELAAEMASVQQPSDDGDAGTRGYAAFAGLDARFHDAVAVGSGNSVLRDCLKQLHTHLKLFRLAGGDNVRSEAVHEHGAVLDAIAAGDPEAAAGAMRRHVERSAERFATAFS